MTPDEAAMAIRQTAARFAAEKASVLEMWAALHEHLHDLCVEQPLIGDFLALFNALEEWEVSAAPIVTERLSDRARSLDGSARAHNCSACTAFCIGDRAGTGSP